MGKGGEPGVVISMRYIRLIWVAGIFYILLFGHRGVYGPSSPLARP